ncbi:MAG: prohibitin family protein [Bacteroidales bacterium]
MLFTIIRILLFIAAIAVFALLSWNSREEKIEPNKKSIISSSFILVLAVCSLCITVVPANTVGVRFSAINGTSEETLSEGIHIKTPFDTVYEIETTVQERTIKDISVQTKDAQALQFQINVKYQVLPEDAFKVYKGYKTLDNLNTNIIRNYSEEALMEVATQYNVIDILGENNNKVHDEVALILKKRFASEGVEFKSITFKDIDAGETIEKAIQDEAVAKKEVETAEQKKQKAIKDAETKKIKAQGEADANAIESEKLTPQILQKMWIEKWDGKLPKVSSDGSLIIDPSSLTK